MPGKRRIHCKTKTPKIDPVGATKQTQDEALVAAALGNMFGSDQTRIAQYGLSVICTILRKNQDYGSSAWETPMLAPDIPAEKAIRVRMSDKIKRLVKLLSQPDSQQVLSESIEDTFLDLAGYCILRAACPTREV